MLEFKIAYSLMWVKIAFYGTIELHRKRVSSELQIAVNEWHEISNEVK